MRATRALVLVGLLTAVASLIGQASAATPATTSLRCSLHAQLKTGQLNRRGTLIGSVSCGRRLGKGVYSGRYRDNVTPSPFTGTETGSSRLAFKAGVVRGTYTITRAAIAGSAPFHGTLHITGGTGQFRHVNGTLKLICAHRIPPLTQCTASGPVSGL